MKGGKFYVSRDAILNNVNGQMTECFRLLGFIPLRTEFLAERDDFDNVGISELFDHCPSASVFPEYDMQITFDVNEAGIETITDVKAVRRE